MIINTITLFICNLKAISKLDAKKMPFADFSYNGLKLFTTGYNNDYKTFNTRGFRKSYKQSPAYFIVF